MTLTAFNPDSPVSLSDLADNSADGVECTVHHPNSRGVAGILSVTIPLFSMKKKLWLLFNFHKSVAC